MMRVVHVVTTGNFAGVERYVCDVARETARRGVETIVVGGRSDRMRAELPSVVVCEPGENAVEAARSLLRVGRVDVCHAHMTIAETLALAARRIHRAPVVATRHFAARRGARLHGRLFANRIGLALACEIATSKFVAGHLERPPGAVIPIGIPQSPRLWDVTNRVVLVLQRLEQEKDTLTALRAWQLSGLSADGWSLRVVGDGSQRRALEAWVESERVAGVTFAGWTADVRGELARAGVVLAPANAEPVGLAVLEAMAAGVPVVASAAGGHLETVALAPDARLFPAGDPAAAAAALRSLLPGDERLRASEAGRSLVAERFTIERHVDRLLEQYDSVLAGAPAPRVASALGVLP